MLLDLCDAVSCLVKNGADVNASTNDNCIPLMIASKYGYVKVITFLVEHGAIIDFQDRNGNTALHYTVRGNSLAVTDKLLTLGASQLYNNQRLTPILYASKECMITMVEELIKRQNVQRNKELMPSSFLVPLWLKGSFLMLREHFST